MCETPNNPDRCVKPRIFGKLFLKPRTVPDPPKLKKMSLKPRKPAKHGPLDADAVQGHIGTMAHGGSLALAAITATLAIGAASPIAAQSAGPSQTLIAALSTSNAANGDDSAFGVYSRGPSPPICAASRRIAPQHPSIRPSCWHVSEDKTA